MATISTLKKGSGGSVATRQDDFVAKKIENVINFADALTAKGSALAALDVIEALVIPKGYVVLNAGLEVMAVDDATTLTVHLGITGAGGLGAEDVDEWVVSFDHAASAAGTYSPQLASAPTWFITTAEDTIDLSFATLTGTLTTGKCRVWAVVCPVMASNKDVGIAQLGS